MIRTRNGRIKGLLGNFIFPAIVICIIFVVEIAPALNKVVYKRQVTVTVTDKGIKNDKEHGRYLIYCKDENDKTQVYQIADSILKLRFNSSDIYPNLEVGKKYVLTIYGYRVPVLSWYPNIYEYGEININ